MIDLARWSTGAGPPVFLLHGLFGSGRNLRVVARHLADRFRVTCLDLRNHGDSPWAEEMTYDAMAGDVAAAIGATPARVIGHSMGGKVALLLALRFPERVERLAVIDIAPVRYAHDHARELDAMAALDPARLADRGEADRRLALADPALRGFLLQNLARRPEGGFRWRLNLDVLRRQMPALVDFPAVTRSWPGPALLVSGAASSHVDARGLDVLRSLCPRLEHACIDGAGHLPHVDRPDRFLSVLDAFLAPPRAQATGGHARIATRYRR